MNTNTTDKGMTKQQAINYFSSKLNWTYSEMKPILSQLKTNIKSKPIKVEIGDVAAVSLVGHPVLVLKKIPKEDKYLCACLTTSDNNDIIVTEVKSRFHINSKVSHTLLIRKEQDILSRFMYNIGRTEAIRVKKEIMNYYKKIIK